MSANIGVGVIKDAPGNPDSVLALSGVSIAAIFYNVEPGSVVVVLAGPNAYAATRNFDLRVNWMAVGVPG